MKWLRYILLALAAALVALWLWAWGHEAGPVAAAAPPPGPGDLDLRVMSFNVLSARGDWHAGPWEKRRDAVVACIRDFSPDLLGAQEVQPDQAEDLGAALPEYGFVGVGVREGGQGNRNAIFWRLDRFEKVGEGHFWLSETPDEPGSRDWFAASPRMVTWAGLRLKERPEAAVYFFNTHFDSVSGVARDRSAPLLRERLGRIAGDSPAIVAGDFNTHAGRKPWRVLTGEGAGPRLIDSYRSIHPEKQGNEGTWHALGGVRVFRRLDWVLHTPHFRAVEAGILAGKAAGRYPSDHCPVTAVLRLERAAG
jgi:endonuclease/exonuclease/phosphatase family metal-dependent hydrolase